ncbi:helix-turn-helix domain-containing protein [Acidithiobacillus sulfuriphilus]|uniref:helix-turn-helix domain-containing protein n=1 Tax=Acidithiobacillus sulfuriphilus TaxID=1867749 RepID=UPI003F62ACE2
MRIRAVSAVRKGQSVEQIAQVFGLNKRTVFRWVSLFPAGGQIGAVMPHRLALGERGRLPGLTQ